ncbi:hypothetical protein EYR40_002605 [Pleurotus pulmonarius]|nr:hypothetical protein EYR40_002605 [Pleurotus pulmonarius]
MFGVLTTTVAILIGSASVQASRLSDALQPSRLRLHARQVSDPVPLDDFPVGCQSLCVPAVQTVNVRGVDPNCQTSRCVCTIANTIALEECLDCTAFATGRSVAAAEADVQSFINQCAKDGFPIAGLPTFSISTTPRPLSTATRSNGGVPTNSANTSARLSSPAPDTPTSAGVPTSQNTISASNAPPGLPSLGNGAFISEVRGGAVLAVMPVLALLQYI